MIVGANFIEVLVLAFGVSHFKFSLTLALPQAFEYAALIFPFLRAMTLQHCDLLSDDLLRTESSFLKVA